MISKRSLLSSAIRQLSSSLGKRGLLQCVAAAALVIVAGGLSTVPAVVLGYIVDAVGRKEVGDGSVLLWFVGIVVVALLGHELLQFTRKWMVERIAVQVQRHGLLKFVDHILSVPVHSLGKWKSGEFISLIDRAVAGQVRLLKLAFLDSAPALASAVSAAAVAVATNWVVGIIMLLAALLNVLVTYQQIRSQKGIRIALVAERAKYNGSLGELLHHLPSIRAGGYGVTERNAFDAHATRLKETEFQHHRAMMLFDFLKNIADGGGFILVIGYAAYLSSQGLLSPGEILALAMLYQRAAIPLQMMHRVVDEAYEAAIQISAAASILAIDRDKGLNGTDSISVRDGVAAFEARGLSVWRGAGEKLSVLSDASFAVQRGSFNILMGKTGAGKSSLLQVILGLDAAYAGSAQVFGTELCLADKGTLATHVAYVAQKPYVRSGTLRSNLLVGSHGAWSDTQMIEALKLSGITLGMGTWADGLDREIVEGGENLSGGERQRIALARVFLSNADIVVLDEATSALDEETEAFVLGNLRRLGANRTFIMVAHRTSTLKWADTVLIARAGKVAVQAASRTGTEFDQDYEPAA